MGEHLIDGEFQSDKYPWCKRGFVPLKLSDPMAHAVLWEYARVRESVDKEFAEDLREALGLQGYRVQCPECGSESVRVLCSVGQIPEYEDAYGHVWGYHPK